MVRTEARRASHGLATKLNEVLTLDTLAGGMWGHASRKILSLN